MARRAFPGRVIFDHLPKTAGLAVNDWLRSSLGTGTVSPGVDGTHQGLITRYGGQYSVISAHVEFGGSDLDPRYEYVTCMREPMDRALSWLFFVLKNHEASQLPHLWHAVNSFLDEAESGINASALEAHICNPYVEHFAAIDTHRPLSESEKLAKALEAAERYAVWGFYESMPDFLADFAGLIGVPAPGALARINVTLTRPSVDRISESLRRRLEELNALDIEFYRLLQGRYAQARRRWQRPALAEMSWARYEGPRSSEFVSEDFALLSVSMEGGTTATPGVPLIFTLEYSLAADIADLEIGVHIFDKGGRWAFGTNTTLLGRPVINVRPGTYRLRYVVVPDLPEGEYTAGFAFAERATRGVRKLAWFDQLLNFHVAAERKTPSVGYASLPTVVDSYCLSERVVRQTLDAQGALTACETPDSVRSGQLFALPVTLVNRSSQDWAPIWQKPINVSYRWIDEHGAVLVLEGVRTPLPHQLVRAGESVDLDLTVQAPPTAGRFKLRALPVQEGVCWFDDLGFLPLELEVSVVDEMETLEPQADLAGVAREPSA